MAVHDIKYSIQLAAARNYTQDICNVLSPVLIRFSCTAWIPVKSLMLGM